MPSHFEFPWYVNVLLAPVLLVDRLREKLKRPPKPEERPAEPSTRNGDSG